MFDDKLGETKKSAPIPLNALPLARLRAEARPIHFIFHTGYCCSTLLCRALDVPGVSMALKEPQIMYAISEPVLAGKDVERRLNALAEDEQWAKLRMIIEIAGEVWGKS